MSKPTLNEALNAVKVLSELGVSNEAIASLNAAVQMKYSFNISLFERLSTMLHEPELKSIYEFFKANNKLSSVEITEIEEIILREKAAEDPSKLEHSQEDHIAVVKNIDGSPKLKRGNASDVVADIIRQHLDRRNDVQPTRREPDVQPTTRRPSVTIVGFAPDGKTKYNEIR